MFSELTIWFTKVSTRRFFHELNSHLRAESAGSEPPKHCNNIKIDRDSNGRLVVYSYFGSYLNNIETRFNRNGYETACPVEYYDPVYSWTPKVVKVWFPPKGPAVDEEKNLFEALKVQMTLEVLFNHFYREICYEYAGAPPAGLFQMIWDSVFKVANGPEFYTEYVSFVSDEYYRQVYSYICEKHNISTLYGTAALTMVMNQINPGDVRISEDNSEYIKELSELLRSYRFYLK